MERAELGRGWAEHGPAASEHTFVVGWRPWLAALAGRAVPPLRAVSFGGSCLLPGGWRWGGERSRSCLSPFRHTPWPGAERPPDLHHLGWVGVAAGQGRDGVIANEASPSPPRARPASAEIRPQDAEIAGQRKWYLLVLTHEVGFVLLLNGC